MVDQDESGTTGIGAQSPQNPGSAGEHDERATSAPAGVGAERTEEGTEEGAGEAEEAPHNPLAEVTLEKVPADEGTGFFSDPREDPLWNPDLEPGPAPDLQGGRTSGGDDAGASETGATDPDPEGER